MKQATQISQPGNRQISENPLFKMSQGEKVVSDLPDHQTSGKNGSLYYEYVQNVNNLRGIVRSGNEVAEFLESLDMIAVDWDKQRYVWKQKPISKSDFLKLVTPKLKSVE